MSGTPNAKLNAIIDDNESIQDSLGDLIESARFATQCFGSAIAFLESDFHRTRAYSSPSAHFSALHTFLVL